jgi:hypothetical protein
MQYAFPIHRNTITSVNPLWNQLQLELRKHSCHIYSTPLRIYPAVRSSRSFNLIALAHTIMSRRKLPALPIWVPRLTKKLESGFSRTSSRSKRFSKVTGKFSRNQHLYASSVARDSNQLQYSLTAASRCPGITRGSTDVGMGRRSDRGGISCSPNLWWREA